MRDNKVSCNHQFYSEHQTIYTIRVRKSHMSKVYNHKDKLRVADKPHSEETCFSIEAHKQIAIASCNE